MKNFNWELFSKSENKIAVWCKTEEEAKDFCKQSYEHGLDWTSGRSRLETTYWDKYKEDTAYWTHEFSCKNWYVNEGYTILSWSDYMQSDSQIQKSKSRAMPDNAIFNMLKDKFTKNGIDSYLWGDKIKKAIALSYKIGYGRALKGKDFEIENKTEDVEPVQNLNFGSANKELCVGQRVKMIEDYRFNQFYREFYPPVGTFGTIVEIEDQILVNWDKHVEYHEYRESYSWWCDKEDVEVVE